MIVNDGWTTECRNQYRKEVNEGMKNATCKVTRSKSDPKKRPLLVLGQRAWHLSEKEAKTLKSSINKLKV